MDGAVCGEIVSDPIYTSWNPVNGQPGSMFGFGFNAVTNWGPMLPAAAITYGALLDKTYAGQAVVLDRIRK